MSKKGGGIPKGGGGFSKGGGGIAKGGSFGSPRPKIGNLPRPARTMDPGKQAASEARRAAQRARQADWDAQRGPMGVPGVGGVGLPGQAGYGTGAVSWMQQAQMLSQQFSGLQDDLMLTSVHDDMGRVDGELATLSQRLAKLRVGGYVFANYLEKEIDRLTDQWEGLRDQMDDEVDLQSRALTQEASQVQLGMQQLVNGQQQLLPQLSAAVQSLGQRAGAARDGFRGRMQGVAQAISQVGNHLHGAEMLLDWVASASFQMLEGEYVVAGTQARFFGGEDESAEGLLLLTDERLIFEQRETVPTRKFLFVTLESEKVQEVDFTALLGWIEKTEIQDSREGLFGGARELLTVTLSSESRIRQANFQILGGTNESWAEIIQRAKNGDIERERIGQAVEEKADVVEKVSDVPTICSNCGAPLPTQIVRGQRTLTCSYCGYEIRLR